MQKNRSLIWIPIVFIGVMILCLIILEFAMSLTDYNVLSPLYESSFTGLDNYINLFKQDDFLLKIGYSALLSVLTVLPSLLLGTGLSFLLGMIPLKPVKAAFAGGALLLALVPADMWNHLVSLLSSFLFHAFSDNHSPLFRAPVPFLHEGIITLSNLFPMTCLSVFAGLTLSISNDIPAWKPALAFSLFPLLSLFLPHPNQLSTFQNSINSFSLWATTSLYEHYAFSRYDFGFSSAISLFCRIPSMLLGVCPALLLGWACKRPASLPRCCGKNRREYWGMIAAVGTAILASVVMLLLVWPFTLNVTEIISRRTLNTIITALMTLPLAFGFCLLIITCARKDHPFYSFGLLAMLLMLLSTFTVPGYLMMSQLDLLNTYAVMALSALTHPIFLIVLVMLAAQRPATLEKTILLAFGGAFVAAACCAGGLYSETYLIYGTENQTLNTAFASESISVLHDRMFTFEFDQVNELSRYTNYFTIRFLKMLIPLVFAIPGIALVMGSVCGICADKPAPQGSSASSKA